MSKKHLKQFLLSVATASAVAAINYTIFHSHYITGAGLNRIFDFTVKCANQLDKLIL